MPGKLLSEAGGGGLALDTELEVPLELLDGTAQEAVECMNLGLPP